jgi:RNA polymerase sigma-70 factor (ECF subfamily)
LFTALTNLCHNHHRWKKRHPTVPIDPIADEASGMRGPSPLTDLASDLPGPDSALAHDELLLAIRAAVDELPHDLKVSMLLHHYQNLSYREIATITHCSERGVETRLYRARQLLRQQLGQYIREASSC